MTASLCGFLHRYAKPLSLVLVGVWALALYVHILRLPFFRDDMVMLLWLRDRTWGGLWVDATGFPYYRPLSFATLKLSELFFGVYQPQFLHVVNLFFHAANSVQILLLTRTVFGARGRTLAGLAAGLLYAAYPFTFEVMPTTGPIFQLQAAFFALATALMYFRFRHSPRVREISDFKFQTSTPHTPCVTPERSPTHVSRITPSGYALPLRVTHYVSRHRWLCLALIMALLGSFTCEYGVIIPPLLIATEIMLWWQARSSRLKINNSQLTINYFFFLPTALYLAAWLAVPKTRSTLPWLWLHDLGYKTLYYIQGLTYPLQPAALPLARQLGLGPVGEGAALSGEWTWPAVALLAALALAGLLLVFARRRRLELLVFGLAWWGMGVAPMWPTLNWDYTSNGPRLHYLPALGTALLWGSAVGLLATSSRRLARGLSVIVFAAALVPGVFFLRAQADVVLTGGQIVDDVMRAVTSLSPDESALIVNFPSWISPARQTYAFGAEGLTFLPGYSTIADMVELNAQQTCGRGCPKRNVASLTFTNVWKPWKLDQRFYTPPLNWEHLLPVLRTTSRVFEVQYTPSGLELNEAGKVQALPPPASPVASFGNLVSLTKATHSRQTGQLIVTLDWASHGTIHAEWTVFLHVYDGSGALVAQGDGDPLLGLYPMWAWQPGEQVHDVRYVSLPADLPPGRYRVGVGLYERAAGRIAAAGPDGQRFADDVVTLFEFER